MFLLVSGATATVREHIKHPHLGILITPHDGGLPFPPLVYGVDNAAFSNWDEVAYLKLLDKIATFTYFPPLFVTAPDFVGNSKKTFDLFWRYREELISRKLPIGYVLQNGVQISDIPWKDLSAIFIGGDDYFKLSRHIVAPLINEALHRKKHVHIGRVNSLSRIDYCIGLGAHSIDGTACSRFPDAHIPKFLDHILTRMNSRKGLLTE